MKYIHNKNYFNSNDIKDNSHITFMTLNIRQNNIKDTGTMSFFYRADLVIENIKEIKPDIIAFQEMQEEEVSYVKTSLIGYSFILKYREEGDYAESCPIFYRADRFSLLESDTLWLSKTPKVMSKDFNSCCYRILTYTILKDLFSSIVYLVINTHLDHISEEAREEGIKIIEKLVKEKKIEKVVLMGDFNDYPSSLTYQKAASFLFDSCTKAKKSHDSITFQDFGRSLSGERIDYIFVSKNIEVESYSVLNKTYNGVYSSDHYPVYIVIS